MMRSHSWQVTMLAIVAVLTTQASAVAAQQSPDHNGQPALMVQSPRSWAGAVPQENGTPDQEAITRLRALRRAMRTQADAMNNMGHGDANAAPTASDVGSPLVLVDGVRVEGLVQQIDPESIVKIEVIKGPSAVTRYGANANSGVIVVTTKKGKQ